MLAVLFDTFGAPPDVLRIAELPMPCPGEGEVVVRVTAAPINPADQMMLSGAQANIMQGLSPPFIAGMEFSGHVHALGHGSDLPLGAPVMGVVNPRRCSGGAHAQFVTVPSVSLNVLASHVDLMSASAVLMNGLTAKMALDFLDLRPGQSVLITGGAGVLGGYAIQLAKLAELQVVADALDTDQAFLKSLDVDLIAPRGQATLAAVKDNYPRGVDGLIDAALISKAVSSLVRPGGSAVSVRKSHPVEDPRLRAGTVMVTDAMFDASALRFIGDLLERRALAPRIAANGVFDFRDAAQAFCYSETPGLRGRVILSFAV